MTPSINFHLLVKLSLSPLHTIPLLKVIPAVSIFALFVLNCHQLPLIILAFFLSLKSAKLLTGSHLLPALGFFAEVDISRLIVNKHEVGKLGTIPTVDVNCSDTIVSLDPNTGDRVCAT